MNLTKLDDLVEATQLAIINTQNNPMVQQQMEAYGLSPAKLQRGQQLLQTLEQKRAQQTKLQNERWALSQQIDAGMQAVQSTFKEHARLSSAAFRHDPSLIHDLQIERLDTRRWDCVWQAAYFYKEFLARKLSLTGLKVSAQEIQQAQRAVHQLQRLKQERADKKGLAEQSTVERQRAQNELRHWMTEFRTIARLAFREQPQLLERFGIRVASSKAPTTL